MLLEKFYELGGSRNMQLNAGDVEVKLVTDLKLEEDLYMDKYKDIGVRRRKKVAARKGRRNSPSEEEGPPIHEEIPSINEDRVIEQVESRGWNGHFGADITAVQRELNMQPGLITEQQARNMRNNNNNYTRH